MPSERTAKNPLTSTTTLLVVASIIATLLFWNVVVAMRFKATEPEANVMVHVPNTMEREALGGIEPGVYVLTVDCKMVRIPAKPNFWVVESGTTSYRPIDNKMVLTAAY